MSGALAGLRVVDLSQMLSGPYATMLLADLGADVIKVEPLSGDMTREYGPFAPADERRAFGGYFASVNRNKRSIALDLKTAAGRDALISILRGADVLFENFRVGVMDNLNLSYEMLHDLNPKLVYVAIRGFGDPRSGASPYAQLPAFDVVAQAMGGLMGITGPDADSPMKVGAGVGDLFPAALSVVGLLAAVLQARETGEGQFVDVAMYDGVLSLCERLVYLNSYSGVVSQPQGNTHPLFCPFEVFACADGHITIAAPSERHWTALCNAMERLDLVDDPLFSSNASRLQHAAKTRAIVSDWTIKLTRAEIMSRLDGLVPAGPVQNAAEIAADPHVAARAMIVDVEQPGCPAPVQIAGSPIKMPANSSPRITRAPLLSEHADDVLSEAGYDQAAIAALRTAGIVG
jgi:crotonobetainyl-CoA:carnitine CoA-transferase CaiB-like acyl-CoA transferase